MRNYSNRIGNNGNTAAREVNTYVPGPAREFHVSRDARDRYAFSQAVFSVQGHVLFENIRAAREFAHSINLARDVVRFPERAVYASEIYGMGFLDEVQHLLIARYFELAGNEVRRRLRDALAASLGPERLERFLVLFSETFPTVRCYRGEETARESLDRSVEGISGRDVAIEELLVLGLAVSNPAYEPARELFDDEPVNSGDYDQFFHTIEQFFENEAPAITDGALAGLREGSVNRESEHEESVRTGSNPPTGRNLLDRLREPARAHPDSIAGQLDYVRTHYGSVLGEEFDRLLKAVDILQEEQRPHFSGPGDSTVPTFAEDDGAARFSPDRDWMPRVILLAKSTLVWLDQLSRWYGYEIRTLDAIPDAELDAIASRGFTGLWLIGIWQRSDASRRIKELMGNAEAAASAYSLYDYEIADELGGWDAVDRLRHRLWQRGVRLASDMVPNHTGIDGRWVYEQPDWFVQLDHSPFPGYTFTGENLSSREDVELYLEDHYFDKTDAAVVFKRVDRRSRRERYIYHGNDGTSMPWNDTAQLDFLNPEVREAVIQTILHVARNFPIIRFDAAMTLAKKHIQRLWHPTAGQGGDIASRSEYGVSDREFHQALPQEFWREVVDRVAQEVPDTLLLAEAFWMMEGYFVRALGMHRVYNSAFMNMLKREENDKYRQTIRNTLEFDPQILKRFVNFMNNPDEDTAVEQFGTGEKYLGVTTVMVTMPGLPMFGHGQVEGFTEKYGMEYRRAYKDEQPDQWLVDQHRRYIFPLMHKRYLFADVEHFRLFDVIDERGTTNENVFAYTNRHGDERTLILYNNSMNETRGRIQNSVPFTVTGDSSGNRTHTDTLGQALGITDSYRHFTLLREVNTGLWYVRNNAEIHRAGILLHLRGYERQVFTDVHEVADTDESHYARLADQLRGAGTPDVVHALKRLDLQPLLDAFAGVANTGTFREVREVLLTPARAGKGPTKRAASQVPPSGATTSTPPSTPPSTPTSAPVDDAEREARWIRIAHRYRMFLHIAAQYVDQPVAPDEALAAFERNGEGLKLLARFATGRSQLARRVASFLNSDAVWPIVALAFLQPLDELRPTGADLTLGRLLDDWMLPDETGRVVAAGAEGPGDHHSYRRLIEILGDHLDWFTPSVTTVQLIDALLADERAALYLGINRYDDILWYTAEAMQMVCDVLIVTAIWRELTQHGELPKTSTNRIATIDKKIHAALEASNYQVEKLRQVASGTSAGSRSGAATRAPAKKNREDG
ncbi:MAG: alpha-amylase family glycosyl hydrolase [Alkalispirochaeta sp.]